MTNVIRFPVRTAGDVDAPSPIFDLDHADLRDSFGVAVLLFLCWEQETHAVLCGSVPPLRAYGLDRDYPPMPSLTVAGVRRTIAEVFALGRLIEGPVPAMVAHAVAMTLHDREEFSEFRLPVGASYAETAEVMDYAVEGVLDAQSLTPAPYREGRA